VAHQSPLGDSPLFTLNVLISESFIFTKDWYLQRFNESIYLTIFWET